VQAFLAAFAALPYGTFRGRAHSRDYVVTRSRIVGGRGEKLVAEALDGSDYISLNLYHLASGTRLKPCEMPSAKVIVFVQDLVPDPTPY